MRLVIKTKLRVTLFEALEQKEKKLCALRRRVWRAAQGFLYFISNKMFQAAAAAAVKVYDAFIYNGEPIVKFRLQLLAPFVDEFIVTESWYTFTGEKKPFLWIERNRAMFEPYLHKIHFQQIDAFPPMPADWPHRARFHNPQDWWREHYQRDVARERLDALQSAAGPFVLICTDVDEIVRPEVARNLRSLYSRLTTQPAFLDMQFFYYNFRWIKRTSWTHGFLVTDQTYRRDTLTGFRVFHPRRLVVPQAGWHCSYFLSCADLQRKIRSFSHQEFNKAQFTDPAHLQQCLSTGKDLFARGPQEDLAEYGGEGLPEGWEAVQAEVVASQLQQL